MSEPGVTTTRFRVGGMDCSAEEQLVRMRLQTVDGISAVAVDLLERTVSVRHSGTSDRIAAALEALSLGTSQLDSDASAVEDATDPRRQHNALLIALAINGSFFVVEMLSGILAQSMGLIADALDMGADAAVYALSLVAVSRSVVVKKRLAATSAYVQFGIAGVGLIEVVRRFLTAAPLPDSRTMIVISLLALAGNIVTLLVLQRVRSSEVHIQASWIFTANDIKVNFLVIAAAVGVVVVDHPAPDLIAGGFIFVIVANGARRILALSRATSL